jgi:hypothetical protein
VRWLVPPSASGSTWSTVRGSPGGRADRRASRPTPRSAPAGAGAGRRGRSREQSSSHGDGSGQAPPPGSGGRSRPRERSPRGDRHGRAGSLGRLDRLAVIRERLGAPLDVSVRLPVALLHRSQPFRPGGRPGKQPPVVCCHETAISDAFLKGFRRSSHYCFSFRACGRNWRRPAVGRGAFRV